MKIHDYSILIASLGLPTVLAIGISIQAISSQIKINSSIIKYELESQENYYLNLDDSD